MRNTIGFRIGETSDSDSTTIIPRDPVNLIRTLVTVRFLGDGSALTYYNDKFILEEGDLVFVSGKMAGKLGIVEKISTKFKINLADDGGYTEIVL